MVRREKTVYFIDGSAQLHRAYFAIRGLATTRGLPTGATYGFTTMLRKLYQDEQPQWCGISFDLAGPTFRHKEYGEYKATRRRMDDDLAVQLPYVRRVCEAFGLPMLDVPGFEADDVIATLAYQAVAAGYKVVVVTGDKDFLQLVSDDILVLNPGREGSGSTLYDRKTVEERFGVPPERVVDVLALVGDAVDNVPGVAGIGEKGARDLIKEYGTMEAVLDNAEKVRRPAYREGLKAHREDAILSKRLVTLRTDAPITLDLVKLERREPNRALAHGLFTELEFVNLVKEFVPEPSTTGTSYEIVTDEAALAGFLERARRAGEVGLSVLRSTREPMRARVVGLALTREPGRAIYVPFDPAPLEAPSVLPRARAMEILRPLLADPAVSLHSARAKHDRILLGRLGVPADRLVFDVGVASYLLNPGRRSWSVEELALEVLGEQPKPMAGIVEGGADGISIAAAAQAAAQEADLARRLSGPMTTRLREEGLIEIFETMEMPLVEVLADMERAGVKINREILAEMSRDMEKQITDLTRDIHALAGGEFNINSPIQLRDVLFARLGMRSAKKTAKTRAMSTAEEVLEELAAEHELPRKILEYRSVQKLKSTYVDALPGLVDPETGRIHASFNQTVAATGRLSTADPNLQNIPIRTPEGRRIREAFVAERGHLLLSADYSQIELRVLAHLSKDKTLIDTFQRGEDVHDRTAREIFGPLSALPVDEQRRVSKMVNYALLYGKSAFTLAKDIGVTKTQAAEFIEAYFGRYPSVRKFIDDTIARARETGTVRTLLGRLRRLPDLRSPNYQIRAEAERQAMNTPVQGSAADLIKKAMIDLHREIRRRNLRARLILQIHDELLLEVPEEEAETSRALVRQVMEGALALDVPLVADARLGATWADVH
ncbi:MAG: DNA polymerase I [Acidobacteria bacterium]|nr:MAG: DNA polymerase I [Acidobacteriota bacterium]